MTSIGNTRHAARIAATVTARHPGVEGVLCSANPAALQELETMFATAHDQLAAVMDRPCVRAAGNGC